MSGPCDNIVGCTVTSISFLPLPLRCRALSPPRSRRRLTRMVAGFFDSLRFVAWAEKDAAPHLDASDVVYQHAFRPFVGAVFAFSSKALPRPPECFFSNDCDDGAAYVVWNVRKVAPNDFPPRDPACAIGHRCARGQVDFEVGKAFREGSLPASPALPDEPGADSEVRF